MLDVEPRALDRPPASAGNVVFAPPALGSTPLATPADDGVSHHGARHTAWLPARPIARPTKPSASAKLPFDSPLAGFPGVVKRGLDIVIATTGLIVGAVPMLLIALLIRLDSPGAPLFRQTRIGINGTRFALWKFRTMHQDACHEPGFRQATRQDPRITRFGAWLRRTSLDELPQLLNVLTGDMSMVGPRPHAPGTRAGRRLFEDVTHRYAARHQIRPGMTGLAQIRGWRGETDTEEKLLLRIESDLEYIANWSLALDLKIIWRTAWCLLRMRNAY
jgi:lipopolysaccharide/colanic/teichoic acid biosynthesis glycosyltransferase